MSVAQEIAKQTPGTELIYIGQKGDDLADVLLKEAKIARMVKIRAGKWRRYHGESFWQHLKDVKTILLNTRDLFYLIIGIFQAYKALVKHKPDSLFIKGGYVGLPVGIAAKIRGIPFLTHDSDVIPGLTNRIVGRWARWHATGMPKGLYAYPREKTVYTGIPIAEQFWHSDKALHRAKLGINDSEHMIFVVGGGLGATRLNEAVLEIAPKLLKNNSRLHIVNVTGKANYSELKEKYQTILSPSMFSRLKLIDFTKELYEYSSAADLVVMRAGATNMAEMAAQGKACILVPSAVLTGGHQTKNAKAWVEAGVAKIYDETEPSHNLYNQIVQLLEHPKARKLLENGVTAYAKKDATKKIAKLIIKTAIEK